MQQSQQQTKRRKPHYTLCQGICVKPQIITLEEEKERLEEVKKRARQIAKELCTTRPSIFNSTLIKQGKKLGWIDFKNTDKKEILSYAAYLEILQILSDVHSRSKLRQDIHLMTFCEQEILVTS